MKLPPFLVVLAIAGIVAPLAAAGQQGAAMELEGGAKGKT